MGDEGAPSPPVIEAAYRAALAWRFRGFAGDARYAGLSGAALRERVVIVPGQAARRAGWWSIGVLIDDVAGAEWTLWIHPERRLLRLLHRPAPRPVIPPLPTRPDGRYYDGMRRRWLMPDGSLAPEAAAPAPPPRRPGEDDRADPLPA